MRGHRFINLLGSAGAIPSFVPSAMRSNPPDLYANLKTNQAWKKSGNLTIPAASLITCSRASTKWQVSSAGVWSSFGLNLLAQSDLGANIEEARTNLFLNSGTPATQTITVASGSTYAVSVVGAGSLILSGALTGTVTQGSPVIAAASSTSLTVTTSGITGSFVNVNVELGASATSPIRTTGTSAARLAEVDTLTTPGAFGSACTLYARGTPQTPATYGMNSYYLSVDDGTANNRVGILRASVTGAATANDVVGGVTQTAPAAQSALSQNSSAKLAFALTAGDAAFSSNGAAVTASAPGALPVSPSIVHLGTRFDGATTSQLNGNLEEFAIWYTQRVSNAQIVAMTQ